MCVWWGGHMHASKRRALLTHLFTLPRDPSYKKGGVKNETPNKPSPSVSDSDSPVSVSSITPSLSLVFLCISRGAFFLSSEHVEQFGGEIDLVEKSLPALRAPPAVRCLRRAQRPSHESAAEVIHRLGNFLKVDALGHVQQ